VNINFCVAKHLVRSRNLKNLKAFGKRLKALRKEKDLTQERLADLAGVSENTIVTLEAGMLNTTIGTCFAIAKALEVHPKDLFDF
jgi:DNA-binding XRE family transcriptional regulator